ncbi:MAG TPA: NUDIX hydrolase [Rhodanobacter sp.]|nr:NUDIX hydrolase [Rhodanobacter sp.]
MQQNPITLIDALRGYGARWPAEVATVEQFIRFLCSGEDVFERWHADGHCTGSAWLVSADGQRVLLMHHRKLNRWLQPGGHADGDTDLARVALREAEEETGVPGLRVEGGIFDIDRHRIARYAPVAHPGESAASPASAPGEPGPVRAAEAEHWHYDVRYVVRAGADEHFTRNVESRALAWRPVQDVADDDTLDDSLRRMARKWLARGR